MSYFFLDTSALIKRYLNETGTLWITNLTDPAAGHTVFVAEITRVESAAAIAARHRASGGISLAERDRLMKLLLQHFDTEYIPSLLQTAVISQAVILTQRHRLRGYDAVQLATALNTHTNARAAGLPGITFITADNDLIAAAQAEGLAADNPNAHP